MLCAVAVASQTVNANANVLFTNTQYDSQRCSCTTGWLSHVEGSGLFTITNRSPYQMVVEIGFNGNVSASATGDLVFTIELNGETISGTQMDYTVATADVYQNIGAATVIGIQSGASVTVSVGNASTIAALVKDANIIIKKVA